MPIRASPGLARYVGLGFCIARLAVYNFAVADFHTYYVTEADILVHNCDKKIAGTIGLEHSFDSHAHEWYGRAVPKTTHLNQWQELLEKATRSNDIFDWTVKGQETIGHLARLENKWLVVQFYKHGDRPGEIATAFIPNRGQLAAMKKLIKENKKP